MTKSKKKKNSLSCTLNMNVQAAMDGQLIIGIPVFENKRIIFDKSSNMIAIGHVQPTFSLFKLAKSSLGSFMKIFSKKSKEEKMQFDEEEQS